jgi:hypothetical protein
MGKYHDLLQNVLGVFGEPAWTAKNIKTVPSNYVGLVNNSEYIRVSVIPSGQGINLVSSSGLLIIDIFVKFGTGPGNLSLIADSLDEFLVGKTIESPTGNTQFLKSAYSELGVDTDNKTLYRAKYEIPFNHFGK